MNRNSQTTDNKKPALGGPFVVFRVILMSPENN
jgi:hypothetical protein